VSVTSPVPDENGIVWTAIGHACFLCHRPLSDPAVHWMGADAEIFLHPACTTDLAVRLFRDLHEIECPDHYAEIREAIRQYRDRR
jgi:hypothetical protein